jgi:ABC-type multidrug transport system ATPase subunit/ABC-type multidrug transport system permease subunit
VSEVQAHVVEAEEHSLEGGLGDECASEEPLEIQRIASVLAATISRTTPREGTSSQETGIDIWSKDPCLNPKDPSFDFHQWAKTLLRELEQRGLLRPRTGFTFKDLNVRGSGKAVKLQQSVGSVLVTPIRMFSSLNRNRNAEKQILTNFNGTVNSGELLIVLGRPGSGSSTFLKSICGQLKGLKMSPESSIHYSGVSQKIYTKELRGDVVYNQEYEQHFPQLTVGQTIRFAAGARLTAHPAFNLSRAKLTEYVADIAMSVFGLRHARDTKVGDDFVRGVSGGERKRVSIAEMAVTRAPIAAWDNSTKGLDAATALDFVQALKVSSQVWGTAHAVAIYQASQNIYDLFDKAIVLYEGRQIYFGTAQSARAYFEEMGWLCPARQTIPDFLTSITNPTERQPRPGFAAKVPRTALEFEEYWRKSATYQRCIQDVAAAETESPMGGHTLEELRAFHRRTQTNYTRGASPYRISVPLQVKLCVTRAYQLLWNDKAPPVTRILMQTIQALIIGSIYYGTPQSTDGFFAKGSILFISVLMNALMTVSEISSLFKQRPIVQKHFGYALYHPFAEALAGILADIPVKIVGSILFNVVLYFLGSLRYEAGPFFIFFLISFIATLTMSAIFRTIAASTNAVSQAMMIAGIMILAIVMYTGFTLRRAYMHPWFKWISYINPISYAFESLLVNEVHGQSFPCTVTSLVPPYGKGKYLRCAVAGSLPGERNVSGDAWANASYGYSYVHLWRNFGILVAFMIFFYCAYLIITELRSEPTSSGEYLVFKRSSTLRYLCGKAHNGDTPGSQGSGGPQLCDDDRNEPSEKQMPIIPHRSDTFSWQEVTLDIPVKDGQRRLLDHVSGWVKPGTLTALMGVSGAGKTTLLDALAQRTKVGLLTGDMLVNGRPLDVSFQRKTGYVQQQDVHMETATVREALRFSAMLRQPRAISVHEKYEWVEEVIKMLGMDDFSEAIVGEPGGGKRALCRLVSSLLIG